MEKRQPPTAALPIGYDALIQRRIEETRLADFVPLASILLAFVALRLPLYTMPGVELGWNSDAAV
jgi:hypothetical protein